MSDDDNFSLHDDLYGVREEIDDLEIIQEPTEPFQESEDVTEQPEQNTDENPGEEASQTKETKTKRILNPQPKLNADRLKGSRGIHILESVFDKIKFKGKGHEEVDLNILMKGYEYWCHRLFPKFRFDDCLEKIERLGSKKEVQTHINKIRMNLLFLDDINGTVPNEADELENLHNSNSEETENLQGSNLDDPFNALLPAATRESNAVNETSRNSTLGLSEDQLERIRINRERAQRIRQQNLISKSFLISNDDAAVNLLENRALQSTSLEQVVDAQSTETSTEVEQMQINEAPNQLEDPVVQIGTHISSPSSTVRQNLEQSQQHSGNDMDYQIHGEKEMDMEDIAVFPNSFNASTSQLHI